MSVNAGPQRCNPQPENVAAPRIRPVKIYKEVATQTTVSVRPEPISGWFAPFVPYVPVAREFYVPYGRPAPYPMPLRTAPVPPRGPSSMNPWYGAPYGYSPLPAPTNYPGVYSSNPFHTQNC
ncbi:uncharacterized protein LOC119767529 [Culex quinquefasciatus]|uniref:uncharacterized protein LOC119767529 n=1 Tax=Culex quinquefasciatus TaxID=7176 RepID=UPI0018E3494F|nr:uncharacterized protein LOC119767529 [Culex quinquefasciatus]